MFTRLVQIPLLADSIFYLCVAGASIGGVVAVKEASVDAWVDLASVSAEAVATNTHAVGRETMGSAQVGFTSLSTISSVTYTLPVHVLSLITAWMHLASCSGETFGVIKPSASCSGETFGVIASTCTANKSTMWKTHIFLAPRTSIPCIT